MPLHFKGKGCGTEKKKICASAVITFLIWHCKCEFPTLKLLVNVNWGVLQKMISWYLSVCQPSLVLHRDSGTDGLIPGKCYDISRDRYKCCYVSVYETHLRSSSSSHNLPVKQNNPESWSVWVTLHFTLLETSVKWDNLTHMLINKGMLIVLFCGLGGVVLRVQIPEESKAINSQLLTGFVLTLTSFKQLGNFIRIWENGITTKRHTLFGKWRSQTTRAQNWEQYALRSKSQIFTGL